MSKLETSPRTTLINSCKRFLQLAVKLARNHFGSADAPLHDVDVVVMEPTKPGSWASKSFIHQEIDMGLLYDFESTKLHTTPEWNSARGAIQSYVDEYKIKPISFLTPNIEGNYLMPLFRSYVRRTRRFIYRELIAERIIRELLNNLDTPHQRSRAS